MLEIDGAVIYPTFFTLGPSIAVVVYFFTPIFSVPIFIHILERDVSQCQSHSYSAVHGASRRISYSGVK